MLTFSLEKIYGTNSLVWLLQLWWLIYFWAIPRRRFAFGFWQKTEEGSIGKMK